MSQSTCAPDAASILFNLDGHQVVSVERTPGGTEVFIEPIAAEAACPDCGVLPSRIQARPVRGVKDVSCGGELVQVRVRKWRLRCPEDACPRVSFGQTTEQIPLRAILTTGLVASLAQAAALELRAVTGLAAAGQVYWTTVMRILVATARIDGDIDRALARRLGIDEHRFRTVRYLADETGRIKRVEPWSIVVTNLDTGTILDIVDGRCGVAVRRWLAERPRWWRARVQLVAIDMSAQFRAAVRTALPKAMITVDHCHGVARANQMITEVRRRRSQTLHGRRGRNSDPAYRYRKLLTCNQENLSVAARGRSWARGRDHPHRPGTQCRVGHQGARPATAADRGHQRLPAGVGRARARGEGHPDAQGQIALREPESPAPAPSGLLPHPSHQRP